MIMVTGSLQKYFSEKMHTISIKWLGGCISVAGHELTVTLNKIKMLKDLKGWCVLLNKSHNKSGKYFI